MASRSVQIRFDGLAHDFIAREAARSGASFAEFVRGAALVRAALTFAATDPTSTNELLALYATADQVLHDLGRVDG